MSIDRGDLGDWRQQGWTKDQRWQWDSRRGGDQWRQGAGGRATKRATGTNKENKTAGANMYIYIDMYYVYKVCGNKRLRSVESDVYIYVL